MVVDKYRPISTATLGFASEDLEAYSVVVGTDVAYPSVLGEAVSGVTMQAHKEGDAVAVATKGQVGVRAGGVIAEGDKLYADTAVPGTVVAIGSPTTEISIGYACGDAAAGTTLLMELDISGVSA